ncbi:MAG: TolC family protein [FCB group bacterium]|nr:TolC family protein [FCB group bacterium]
MKFIGMIILILAFAVSQKSPAVYQDDQLEMLLRLAIKNNPEIKSREESVSAFIHEAKFAGSLPDPQLTAGYFFTPVETKVGPQEWRVGLMQKFPWFDKLSTKRKVSLLKAEVATQQLRASKLKIAREVRTVYQKLRLLAVDDFITRKNLEIFKQVEAVIRAKYTTGTARQAHLIQLQVEILKLEDQLETLDDKKIVYKADLADYLGGLELPALDFGDLDYYEEELIDGQALNFDYNPEMQIANLQVEIARRGLHLAKLASIPDFSLGVDYVSLGGTAGDNPLMAKAGISLPLWFGKNSALRGKATAVQQSAEYRLRDTEEKYVARLEELRFKLEDQRRKFHLYVNELIPLAEQSYQTSEAAYLGETLDFASYLDAERTLLNLQLAAARARSDYYIAQAKYLEINGSEF